MTKEIEDVANSSAMMVWAGVRGPTVEHMCRGSVCRE